MVANAWMRSGNTSDLNNYSNFLDETFDVCLKDHKVGLVRADSGFYSQKFLEYFENRNLNYIVAVKFYENIKYTIGSVTKWVSITKGLEVASLRFKPDNGKERRYIIVRKLISEYLS